MINSLQLWLAVLGGVVIAGVLVHGAWQARRAGGSLRAPPPTPSRQFEPGFSEADTVLEDRRDSALHADEADEVDAPLDDANTERYRNLVTEMSQGTQFLFISHNKIAMEMAEQLVGVTMQEQGVSRIVAVDMKTAVGMAEAA